jgi:hypothetical protein
MEFGIESTLLVAFLLVAALIFLYMSDADRKEAIRDIIALEYKLTERNRVVQNVAKIVANEDATHAWKISQLYELLNIPAE